MQQRSFVRSAQIFCLLFLLLISLPSMALASKHRAAILVDMSNEKILYAHNPDMVIPPASLTKVLSMYVALDYVRNGYVKLSDFVTVSKEAAKQPGSRMSLRAGEKVRLDRLLYGMAVSSGNDASLAIAEHIAGSQKIFVRLMNQHAKELNMERSFFQNPHGLPAKKQVTTARDMATLACSYLKNHPEALRYHNETQIRHNGRLSTNKNPVLGTVEGADGLKTGWITASGYNLISTVKRGDTRLVAVVLGAKNANIREETSINLLEAGFDSLEKGLPVEKLLATKNYAKDLRKEKNYARR